MATDIKKYNDFYNAWVNRELHEIETEKAKCKAEIECRALFPGLISSAFSVLALLIALTALVFDGSGMGPDKMEFYIYLIHLCMIVAGISMIVFLRLYITTRNAWLKLEALNNIMKHQGR